MSIHRDWTEHKVRKFLNRKFQNGDTGQILRKGSGDNWDLQWGGAVEFNNEEVVAPKLKAYSISNSALTSSNNALTLDYSDGPSFQIALSENIDTFTISNVPASGSEARIRLLITQDDPARTITWPSSFKWPAGTAPTLTTVDSIHAINAFTLDGGTNWYATFDSEFS